MIADLISELTEYISIIGKEDDLVSAKKTYFKDTAGLFGDEECFDTRIANFLEWYIFDRRMGGINLLEEFIKDIDDEDKKKLFHELTRGVRSVFEIKKISKDTITFKDLKDGNKYVAFVPSGVDGFKKGEIIDARLLPQSDHYSLSASYLFHHGGSKKFITAMVKDAYGRKDLTSALTTLANMSLKWEKYRNYKAEDIYKIKETDIAEKR